MAAKVHKLIQFGMVYYKNLKKTSFKRFFDLGQQNALFAHT